MTRASRLNSNLYLRREEFALCHHDANS